MEKSRMRWVVFWAGMALFYLVGPAATGLSDRAIDARETVSWPVAVLLMLGAFIAGAMLLWGSKTKPPDPLA